MNTARSNFGRATRWLREWARKRRYDWRTVGLLVIFDALTFPLIEALPTVLSVALAILIVAASVIVCLLLGGWRRGRGGDDAGPRGGDPLVPSAPSSGGATSSHTPLRSSATNASAEPQPTPINRER